MGPVCGADLSPDDSPRLITSGARKAPPISTSSPRGTITSPPAAIVASTSNTAAALLLTYRPLRAGQLTQALRDNAVAVTRRHHQGIFSVTGQRMALVTRLNSRFRL